MDQQAYELYRAHYRAAVQSEFLRRVHNAGYNGDQRNVAEELHRIDQGFDGQSRGGPNNNVQGSY